MTAEPPTRLIYCQQAKGLLEAMAAAIHGLVGLHQQQFIAVIEGDAESGRFDDLIDLANERKRDAKYAYLQHLSAHGCSTLR